MPLNPEAALTTPTSPCPIHLQRLRIKAKHDIGENEELILEKILELRQIIEADSSVNPPPKHYDEFLLRCLRARKYDMERAAKTYKKLCLLNHTLKEVTDYFVPSEHNALFHKKFVSIVKGRDNSGRQLLFIRVEKWEASKHSIDEVLAALFMSVDQVTSSEDTQLNGIVVVVDFKGFGFGHARQVTPSRIQGIVSIIQESFPANFKEFHFYNHPTLFNMVFALAKPFLKEKIRKRIFFHGHDLSAVHKNICPSLLPSFAGGELPDNEYVDQEALQSLMKKDDYFKGMREHFFLTKDVEES